jgi:hypothetical protein
MKFNPGKAFVTWADIEAAGSAHPDNTLGWVRGMVGDTPSTRAAISGYAAARKALGCE